MPTIEARPLPPEEAIAYFTRKGLKLESSFDWRDMWQECHATAFTVAKSTGFDILGDIHEACRKNLTEGRPFKHFAAELTPLLQQKGWWGRKTATDPSTGEEKEVQLGSPQRLRTIYDVNLRMSQAAGVWEQAQRTKGTRPYLRYVILGVNTRPEHRQWHNVVLHMDDPWWDTHYPLNGWRCHCTTQQYSAYDLADFGITPSASAPPSPLVPWQNKRTGETQLVPQGIDPGFAYNVGKAGMPQQAARAAMDKVVNLPPALGAQAVPALAAALPAVEKDLSTWIQDIVQNAQAGNFRAKGERRIVGALSPAQLDFLARLEKPILPSTAAISIADKDILHAQRSSKKNALSPQDMALIPKALHAPRAKLWDKQQPGFVYVFDVQESAQPRKLIVQVDVPARVQRETVRLNTVRSGRITHEQELKNKGRYVVVEGEI